MSTIKQFNFIVEHVDSNETVTTILQRDFGMPFKDKEQITWMDKKGFPTKQEEGVFENSYHAVELAEDIFSLLRMVLKDASEDYINKYGRHSTIERTSLSDNSRYQCRIVDVQYPKRDKYGRIVQKYNITYTNGKKNSLTSENISYDDLKKDKGVKSVEVEDVSTVRDIFKFAFDASDFIEFNPNFIPQFWKIWKDYSNFYSDNPNSRIQEDGITKSEMHSGIRTLLKDALRTEFKYFVNRFYNVELVRNNYNMV